jgi:hypothetical protein
MDNTKRNSKQRNIDEVVYRETDYHATDQKKALESGCELRSTQTLFSLVDLADIAYNLQKSYTSLLPLFLPLSYSFPSIRTRLYLYVFAS